MKRMRKWKTEQDKEKLMKGRNSKFTESRSRVERERGQRTLGKGQIERETACTRSKTVKRNKRRKGEKKEEEGKYKTKTSTDCLNT